MVGYYAIEKVAEKYFDRQCNEKLFYRTARVDKEAMFFEVYKK